METYKLVVVVVKPFVDANMWRKGLAQRLSNLEERTQEVQTIATVIPIGCLPKSSLCVSCGVLEMLPRPGARGWMVMVPVEKPMMTREMRSM